MALPPEAVADRRRLTRRVVVWRSVAALAAAFAVLAWVKALGLSDAFPTDGPRVAVLKVTGVIVSDDDRRDALKAVAEDADVKALVLLINSPGGTFVGSDALHQQVRAVAANKPVVAVIDDVAASGGYMAAVAADRVLASRGSITASVGVIFQSPRISRLMDQVGVDMDVWRSGDLKALPSPFEESPPAAREQAQDMVDKLFLMFLAMVTDRRNLSPSQTAIIRDGRVVTGQTALDLNLIDQLGDEAAARQWLAAEKAIAETLPTADITPEPELERGGFLSDALAYVVGRPSGVREIAMSGLLALWRPLAPGDGLR